MGCTCAVAGAFWARVIRRTAFDHWSMNLVGFVIAFMTLWGIYAIIDRLTTSNLRLKRCPKCKGELKIVGGGFYDGMVPNPWELLVYVLTIGLGYLVMNIHRYATESG